MGYQVRFPDLATCRIQHLATKPLDTSLHLIKCCYIVSILEFFTIFYTKLHDGYCHIFERQLWCDLGVMELVDSDGGNIQSCKKTSPIHLLKLIYVTDCILRFCTCHIQYILPPACKVSRSKDSCHFKRMSKSPPI